jgi:hypothetical protein
MNANDVIQTGASIATAVGVLFAWRQIRLTTNQAASSFEDELTAQYREIASRLPVAALLGETLNDSIQQNALSDFYRYIDLTNEQIFLRQQGRVRESTWANWAQGIRSHLGRPAFASAWSDIKARAPDSFTELRRLEKERFSSDPATWHPAV